MAILNQKKILNLIPKVSAPVTIHVSQGDVGTQIEFTLVKGDELFVNPGNVSASVHGVREDGANFGAFTCTLSGSTVSFPLHSEMTAVKGSALAEIVIVDNDGNKVGSANFAIMVEESVFPLGVTYDNDVSVYESILAYVQTIPAQVTEDYTSKINAEIAARQAAIDSLHSALANEVSARQGSVNSEANTRAAADSALDARIDQIIAPSGEAPSAAEVTDARIGADGVTYPTLGGAVRNQVNDIKTSSNKNPFLFWMLEPGTFGGDAGDVPNKISNITRVRNAYFIPVDAFERISVVNGYEMWVTRLNENFQIIEPMVNSWVTEILSDTHFGTKYISIVFRNADNSSLDGKIAEINESVVIKSNLISKPNIMSILKNMIPLEIGTYTDPILGQKVEKVWSNAAFRTTSYVPINLFNTIKIDSPYRFIISGYDSDFNYTNKNTGWVREYNRALFEDDNLTKYLLIAIRKENASLDDISGEYEEVCNSLHTYDIVDTVDLITSGNLLDNSKSVQSFDYSPYSNSTAREYITESESVKYDGEPIFYMYGSEYICVDFPELVNGMKYTFSFDISRGDYSGKSAYVRIGSEVYGGFVAPQGEWNRISVSFTANVNTTNAHITVVNPDESLTANWSASVRKFCLKYGDKSNIWELSKKDEKYANALKILGIHQMPTPGQLNAIKRARQLTDIKWKPISNLTRICIQGNESTKVNGNFFEDYFLKGTEYVGLPYSETNHMQDYGYNRKAHIGETIGIETFVTSVRNENSAVLQESVYRPSDHSASLYGCVCSNLTSYALGIRTVITGNYPYIKGMVKKGKLSTVGVNTLDLCDLLLVPNYHIAIITDFIRDELNNITHIEVSEATYSGNDDNSKSKDNDGGGEKWGGVCRRKWWVADEFLDYWGDYIILKYTKMSEIKYIPNKMIPMLDEVKQYPNPNLACMPYTGNKFIYKKDYIPNTNILISSTGYNSLVVKKDGVKWNADSSSNPYQVSGDVVEVGFSDVGTYEAYLANIVNGVEDKRTEKCEWRVSDATITTQTNDNKVTFTCVLPDSFDKPCDVLVNTDSSYPLNPWLHLTDNDLLVTELSGGRMQYIFNVDSSEIVGNYYQVAFTNIFGGWHTDIIAF